MPKSTPSSKVQIRLDSEHRKKQNKLARNNRERKAIGRFFHSLTFMGLR